MMPPTSDPLAHASPDEIELRALYRRLLAAWNARNADAFATTFTADGESIGFDGSQLTGRAEIAVALGQIFAGHATGAYVDLVRHVRVLAPGVAVLRAVVGMIPAGQSDIESRLNAMQTVIAAKQDGKEWRIVLLQNTPAQFHGQPKLVRQLTEELRRARPTAG
ncbi:MAG: SgcJ/EcaC family oxidoreductase [Ktedonobacterales bacterium]